MKLNSRQVADKLGVTLTTVRSLRNNKLITDLGMTKKGKAKHVMLFDYKEINEFSKSYKKSSRSNKRVQDSYNINDKPISLISNINSRLLSIESKINTLIKIWR